MDLAILALENLHDTYSAFVTVAALRRTANVGVSTTSQILEHHLASERTNDFDTIFNCVNCWSAATLLHLVIVEAVSESVGAARASWDHLVDNRTDQLVITHICMLLEWMTVCSHQML